MTKKAYPFTCNMAQGIPIYLYIKLYIAKMFEDFVNLISIIVLGKQVCFKQAETVRILEYNRCLFTAAKEGHNAFADHKGHLDNPYNPHTDREFEAWHKGWWEAYIIAGAKQMAPPLDVYDLANSEFELGDYIQYEEQPNEP